MEKIIMIVEKSKDFFDAYSDNCDGIYAAGDSIETVKANALEAINLIKKNLPEDRWPKQIKGEFEIEWKFAGGIQDFTLNSQEEQTPEHDWIDDLDWDRFPSQGPFSEEEAIARIDQFEEELAKGQVKWIPSEQVWERLYNKYPWLRQSFS